MTIPTYIVVLHPHQLLDTRVWECHTSSLATVRCPVVPFGVTAGGRGVDWGRPPGPTVELSCWIWDWIFWIHSCTSDYSRGRNFLWINLWTITVLFTQVPNIIKLHWVESYQKPVFAPINISLHAITYCYIQLHLVTSGYIWLHTVTTVAICLNVHNYIWLHLVTSS